MTFSPHGSPEHAPRHEQPLRYTIGLAEQPHHDEDRSLVDRERGLTGVWDGVGGAYGGGNAAQVALRQTIYVFSTLYPVCNDIATAEKALRDAFQSTRDTLADSNQEGSTTANVSKIVHTSDGSFFVAMNAGDSRSILWRGGKRRDLTTEQLSLGTPDARQKRNVLNNALWANSNGDLDELIIEKLEPGDKILQCSDGITGDAEYQWLSDEEFGDGFGQPTAQEAADRFVRLSKKRDDKTAIVIFFDDQHQSSVEPARHSDIMPHSPAVPSSSFGRTLLNVLREHRRGIAGVLAVLAFGGAFGGIIKTGIDSFTASEKPAPSASSEYKGIQNIEYDKYNKPYVKSTEWGKAYGSYSDAAETMLRELLGRDPTDAEVACLTPILLEQNQVSEKEATTLQPRTPIYLPPVAAMKGCKKS